MAVVHVDDAGIWYPPAEYRDRVFRMFQRLHVREAYAGTGIGLAIRRSRSWSARAGRSGSTAARAAARCSRSRSRRCPRPRWWTPPRATPAGDRLSTTVA